MAPGTSHGYTEESEHVEDTQEDIQSAAFNTPDKYELEALRIQTLRAAAVNPMNTNNSNETEDNSSVDSVTNSSAHCVKVDKDPDKGVDDLHDKETDSLLHKETGEDISDTNEEKDDATPDDILEEKTKAPDGGWGWFIVLGAVLLRVIIGGMGRSHGLFYIKFKERYDDTATATAFVTALTAIFRLAGGPFVSILCARFTCRSLSSLGALLLTSGLLLTAFSPSLQFLYFSYGVICGIGRAFALTPVPILLGYYFDKRRSLAFGLASAGFSIGGFGITPLVEVFFQTFGFQGTFILLSGFALNVVVCAALFRPIELHRKITRKRSQRGNSVHNAERLVVRSIEDIQSEHILSSSNVSIEKVNASPSILRKRCDSGKTVKQTEPGATNLDDKKKSTNGKCNNGDANKIENSLDDKEKRSKDPGSDDQMDKQKKKPLIAWSILKDVRFLCFCFSNFVLTLPTSILFLPSLAMARGATVMEGATLLSINAGADTVSRVTSGFIMDLKIFRKIRPQIYSTVILIQGFIILLYPHMNTYPAFVVLCLIDGLVSGLKAAQNAVVVMDILGVDKLASSMVLTMSVQAVAVLIGPTVAGRIKDITGVYDGAFYFSGAAVILGGIVMTGGNIRKSIIDKRIKREQEKKEEQLQILVA